MKTLVVCLFALSSLFGMNNMSIYDFEVKKIDGQMIKLETYKNRVMLIHHFVSLLMVLSLICLLR